MKTNHRRFAGILVTVLSLSTLALAGCEAQKHEAQAPSAAAADINRATAIQFARQDAAFRYSDLSVTRVDARRHGSFWVVELTSPAGSGLRYTISANDGAIRERNTFQ